MNTETGEIKRFAREIPEELKNKFISINEGAMTEKQKETMQVSKHDNKSELGKLFTQHRKLTRAQRNRKKRQEMQEDCPGDGIHI